MCIIILILAEVPAHLSITRHMRWGITHVLRLLLENELCTFSLQTLHLLYNGIRRVVFVWLLRVSDDRWLMAIEWTGRQVLFWESVKWCCLLSWLERRNSSFSSHRWERFSPETLQMFIKKKHTDIRTALFVLLDQRKLYTQLKTLIIV